MTSVSTTAPTANNHNFSNKATTSATVLISKLQPNDGFNLKCPPVPISVKSNIQKKNVNSNNTALMLSSSSSKNSNNNHSKSGSNNSHCSSANKNNNHKSNNTTKTVPIAPKIGFNRNMPSPATTKLTRIRAAALPPTFDSNDPDDRKKRCADRYDSSESSDR